VQIRKIRMSQLATTLLTLGGFGVLILICYLASSAKVEAQAVDSDKAWERFTGLRTFILTFYRQSGNVHKVLQVTGSRADVENEILKVFNRAGIGDQYMVCERDGGIDYRRAFHNHRGSNEGRKVGGCVVTAG
jgi:hypothetical protein